MKTALTLAALALALAILHAGRTVDDDDTSLFGIGGAI